MDLAELDAGFDPTPRANSGVHATFYIHTARDNEKSAEEGRPIYVDHVYIRGTIAGDRGSVIERPATDMDKRRYAVQYKHFLANAEAPHEGIPLGEWSGMSRSQVEEFKFFNVHTVEDLANVSDANGQKFPMFMSMREKAKNYLLALKDNEPLEKIQAELVKRDEQIAALMQNQEEMIAEMKALKTAKGK